jgi:hypothetical protein
LVLQLTVALLQNHPEVRAVIGNVEMTPADLLAKIAARLASVPVDHIADKTYTPGEREKVKKALAAHDGVLRRLTFLEPPYTLTNLAGALTDSEAKLAIVDYVQRFGAAKDLRESLDGLMTGLRKLAAHGAAVVGVSSVARQKDDKGRSSYAKLGLASFRGSAELEFGSDSAYILEANNGVAVMRCVKNRYGKPADIHLRFNGAFQRYDPGEPLDGFDAACGAIQAKGSKR